VAVAARTCDLCTCARASPPRRVCLAWLCAHARAVALRGHADTAHARVRCRCTSSTAATSSGPAK
jgi:hypothetical protein